ncbi:MAG TPA: urea ABC transporter permease subunit UrtB [Opitutaceae bacterium]|jgi:urea transport system permease protein|nr:urea ABC transporter permease subunit UrtB [Opitutaceae bacterium]
MKTLVRFLGLWLACAAAALRLAAAPAPDEAAVRPLLVRALLAEGVEQQRLLAQLSGSGSRLAREVLTAWTRDEVVLYPAPDGARVPVILEDQQDAQGRARAVRVDSGRPLLDPKGAELRFAAGDLDSVDTDMRLRSSIQQALDALTLADPDPVERRSAVAKLGNSQKAQYLPALRARLAVEANTEVRRALGESIALLQLGDPDVAVRVAAIGRLADLQAVGALDRLSQIAAAGPPPVTAAARAAIAVLNRHISTVNFFGTIFRGISLGSILLVVALGLAITFGLMGVINMAHGEMIAVGAYTTYVVQNVFGSGFGFHITLPFSLGGKLIGFGFALPGLNATGGWYESYFLFAIPLSFLAAALAGLAVERAVIRFLYRRPLESLLATWGVSLIMQQLFRMVFGANNVQVNSPSWLLGHFSIHDVEFGYNRVFVIAFAVLIVVGTWLLLTRTPLGLLIRAVMQNRDMAACMGVRTERVNMLTFAFGSGLAGLAGAFLSQIGNVGPSLGQNYIVDAFMTVVVGGVGSIVGTVYSAAGIGTADQVLQQVTGSPVMGKIVVLGCIILFLQWKPGGLFATRSRNLD